MEMTVEMCRILQSGDFLGTFLCTSLSDTGDSRLHRIILFNQYSFELKLTEKVLQ